MQIPFFLLMGWFQDGCMLLSLLFSLKLINNDKVIKYMKYFYWYSIVGGILVLLKWTNKNYSFPSNDIMSQIRNYSVLFHFTFLSVFIYSILPRKNNFKLLLLLFFSIVFITVFCLVTGESTKANSVAFSIGNLGLVICCIIYFFGIFNNSPNQNLLKEPSFWIVSGIFLCMSAAIPVLSLYEYLRNENYVSQENKRNLTTIIYFAYGSLHLFLIKAYLCSISLQKN